MIRALIVDDEPPARRRLRVMLASEAGIEVVAEAGTAAEAADAITSYAPDLVFLDIHMPEGDGFSLLGDIGPLPAVIFVTAYGEHAVRAFEVSAVDYLMKPFDRTRLGAALDKARAHLAHQCAPLRRIPVEAAGRIRLVDTADLDYVRAERNYVRLHATGRTYLLRQSLTRLERLLDPREFLRIHRSLIVRLERVVEIETLEHGELSLHLLGGVTLVSGRSYRERVRSAFGLDR